MSPNEKATAFAALHVPGDPLILFNIWDAGSAQAVERAGAKAVASGSASVAGAYGARDGEDVPLDEALANAGRIVASVSVPVTIDFEGGYAVGAEEVAANVARLAAIGAVGCNFEDQVVGGEGMHPTSLQAERIAAVRKAVGENFFINARTDYFLQAKPADHDGALADAAIERVKAYADAGASGFFIPGLTDRQAGRADRRGVAAARQRDDLAGSADARAMGRRGNCAHQLRAGPVSPDAEVAGGSGPRRTRLIPTCQADACEHRHQKRTGTHSPSPVPT